MRLLLDTHIALWSVVDPERLSRAGLDLIEDPENETLVSAVSIWEIAVKFSLGRGSDLMPISGSRALEEFAKAGFELVSVSPEQAAGVDRLSLLHRDPFDRLLIAQALHEPLRLITHDSRVAAYSPHFILV